MRWTVTEPVSDQDAPPPETRAGHDPISPLHIADFRRFWLTRFTNVLATSGMVVVLGYQLYDLARGRYGMTIEHAAFQLGLLGLVQFVPQFFLTPVSGLVADRFDRRAVAGLAMTIDLIIALALAMTTETGLITLPLLFMFAALHGMARVFQGPALSAIVPNVVPAGLMPRAVAISAMGWQFGAVGGPALAGVLFAAHSALPYWLASALLAASVAVLSGIRRVPPPAGNRNAHPVRQIAEGLIFVWKDHFLLGCVTLDLFAVLLAGATALLPIYARDILAWHGHPVGANGLGIMRAMPAIGAASIGAILARRPITHDVGAKMLWAVAGFGAATIGFGLSRNIVLSLAMLALLGATDMISVFIRNSLVQLHTPDAVRGRVSAISGLAISASNELGEMESGLAAALLGATGAVVLGGVGAIVVTALWAVGFPELRRARTFAARYQD